MFKKFAGEVGGSAQVKTSVKRKLREELTSSYPSIPSADLGWYYVAMMLLLHHCVITRHITALPIIV
jgi:hypothetical protein